MERVLGTPALFATAYGNVGSSIYYALGLTAVYALGLTPLVFVVAGIVFAATAATYAEGTARFPEAGGSASFSRHAFDEVVSFTAGWAQMLVYVVTVAVSAFFVPHYLSIFWEPLRDEPVGHRRRRRSSSSSSSRSTSSACRRRRSSRSRSRSIDFATQVLLVIVGFALVFSPEVLVENVHWGVAPTWSNLAISIPVAMLAYTGVETVSNLAEEARDPVRTVPNSYKLVAGAVFAIYFTLPLVALSALPVETIDGELTTLLALPPEEGGYANDPILGVVENIGLEGLLLDAAEIYVGVLAATILFIATNAGVIGASRITYSMATYRQLPEALRRLHPRFKTPWLSLVLFAGIAPILVILPGDVNFVGTLYSLGATLSFTVAHASIVRLRMVGRRRGRDPVPRAAEPPDRRACRWPLFALPRRASRRASRSSSSSSRTRSRAGSGSAGWSPGSSATSSTGGGSSTCRCARDREGAARARAGARARVPEPPRARHRGPVVGRRDGRRVPARRRAARADRRVERARGPARPGADGPLPGAGGDCRTTSSTRPSRSATRTASASSRGSSARTPPARRSSPRPTRGTPRSSSSASPRRHLTAGQSAVFGKTVDYVLKHANCRVLVTAAGRGVRRYSVAVLVFAAIFVAIGVALLVRTAAAGGGVVGYVLGGALHRARGRAVHTRAEEARAEWRASSAGSSAFSTPRRSSPSRTARSRRRCTSRSASSPRSRSG